MGVKKVFKFVKDHKKEFIAAGAVVIGGTVLFVLTRKMPKFPDLSDASILPKPDPNWRNTPCEKAKAIGWGLGTMTDLWSDEGGSPNAIITNLKIDDLGKLGDELLKVEGISKEQLADIVISTGEILVGTN